ncbi:hypothetical protein niasHT_029097 [Heterodera trifolii]|uniref:Uncharacterized protein n=1 Tax=Heterodera trifolii TaxID=157864 RepID=A0ABD2KMZ6_9BILA
MAQIVTLVSFLILVLSLPNALSIDTNAVKEMATQFSSLTSSTWDIVNQLRFVSENAMEFVRAAGAVGVIIATAVDTEFGPESDEQKAIKELHEFIKTKFEALERHRQRESHSIKHNFIGMDYQNTLVRPLDIIEDVYKGITDPREEVRSHYKEEFIDKCKGINTAPHDVMITVVRPLAMIEYVYKGITDPLEEVRSHYKEEFIDKCQGKRGTAPPYHVMITVIYPLDMVEPHYKAITDPLKHRSQFKESFIDGCRGHSGTAPPYHVLIHMKHNLATDCQLPSQEQLERYAAVLELFQKIEQRHHHLLNHNDFLLVKKYKSIKSSILAKAAMAPMQEKLNTILNSASSAEEVWQALNKLNTDFHYANNTCWIQSIADGNEWKREPILHFAQLVFLDLMKTSLIASHCANVIYAGKQKDIDIDHRNIKLRLQEITTHMADWIAKMMEITWPTISRFYAKSAIGNLPINESKDAYQFVAEKIKEELGQFGAAEYDYTVIVFPNWTNPEAMAIISEANSYFDLIDINQINVIVVRIEDNETNFELACKATEWFTPTIESKMKDAIKMWWDHKRHLKLSDLADILKELLQFYRHLVLIHNWKFFSSAATITLGVTQSFIRSAHKIVPSFFDAEIFHVHMLL